MTEETRDSRRGFLRLAGGAGMLLSAAPAMSGARAQPRGGEAKGEEDVSPAEDLMREHGVLERVLLIYDEAIRRLDGRQELDPVVLTGSAAIVRRFIEDYHEKLEEDALFPRFERARILVELVATLRAQHQAGRRLTDRIRELAPRVALKASVEHGPLAQVLGQFIRMYRPHAAREDTVLFPALRGIVSPVEYDAMGEAFEREEHRLFGEDGFEKVVDEVARLERQLGIEDLAQFTPTP